MEKPEGGGDKGERDAVREAEFYAILLKEFAEFRDDGREMYLDELIARLRRERD
ncbi:MAG: hypothetical protein LBG62_01145 [Candidatus Methanoplasma sp.]|jgi:hypothetical protein|nr:hypothetical protein [Candidatus Methanoplasma sp.]